MISATTPSTVVGVALEPRSAGVRPLVVADRVAVDWNGVCMCVCVCDIKINQTRPWRLV